MGGVADSYDLPDVRAGSQTQTPRLAVLTLVKNVLVTLEPSPQSQTSLYLKLCFGPSLFMFTWGVTFSLLKNFELEA